MKTERVNLPQDLYKSWLEDETNKVDKLTADEIQGRIMELEKIIFESKTRLSIAHQKRIGLMGKDWADNSRAISSPDFRVNYEKDQREKKAPVVKKTKEEKAATLNDAAGIDTNKLKELIKAKMLERAKKPMVAPTAPKPATPVVTKPALPLINDEDDD